MQNALKTWKLVTSPYKSKLTSPYDFPIYDDVNKWLNGLSQQTLHSFIEEIGIVVNEEEFAVLYGLKVLEVLMEEDAWSVNKLSLDNHIVSSVAVMSQEIQMLVICRDILSPFFVQLGCDHIDSSLEDGEIVRLAISAISQKKSISLILVDSKNNIDLIPTLRKKIDSNIVVAPFEPNIQDDQGYFDTLVKQTLGIRLV